MGPEQQGKSAKGGSSWPETGVGSAWGGHMGRGKEAREDLLLALPDQALPTPTGLLHPLPGII